MFVKLPFSRSTAGSNVREMHEIDKKAWVISVAKGRTFADIGSLWGTVNEMVSVACKAGSPHGTMIDIQSADDELWRAFNERMATLDVAHYSCLSSDFGSEGFSDRVGSYDLVHCSGAIYHLPDPFALVLSLRKIAREYLVFTSMYVPELVSNDAGKIDLGGGGAIMVHAMTDKKKRAVIVRHFELLGLQVAGLTLPMEEPLILPNGRGNTSPWWWLMTPSLLRSMLEIAGFEILDEGDSWAGRSRSFLCKAKAA